MNNELKFVSPDDVFFYTRNPRKHTDAELYDIRKSVERNGWGEPILVDGDTKEVLSGNGRLKVARDMGLEKIPAYFVYGLTDKQKADLVIASNKLREIDGYNAEILEELIKEFNLADFMDEIKKDDVEYRTAIKIDLSFFDFENDMVGKLRRFLRTLRETSDCKYDGDNLNRYLNG